jgi:hypothetical protein
LENNFQCRHHAHWQDKQALLQRSQVVVPSHTVRFRYSDVDGVLTPSTSFFEIIASQAFGTGVQIPFHVKVLPALGMA